MNDRDVIGDPPYPGSDAAIAAGCTCPVLDNGHGNVGLARDRGGWIIVVGCPLHSGDTQDVPRTVLYPTD